jgi:hypothetical protein
MKKSHLYVFQCQQFFKVGFSSHLQDRLNIISNATPFDVKIVHSISFEGYGDHKTAEKIAHQHLIDLGLHERLEWFHGEKDVIISICESAAEIAKHEGRLRSSRAKERAMHALKICRIDAICDLAKIQEPRIIELLNGAHMQKHEVLKINTMWELIYG